MLEHFFNHQFVYVFLLILVIFAISSVFVKNKLLKKFCILFFAVFYSLFFMELLLSFFMQEPITTLNIGYLNNIKDNSCHKCRDAKYIDKNNMTLRFSGEIFNDIKFTQSEYCTLVHDVTYTEYSNGFRYTKCNESSDETYLFLGCSFTFGTGIKDTETLPYHFSEQFDFKKNVINCGVGGQGTNTALNIVNNNIFEKLLNKNSQIKHCFYTLIKDHIYRNFRYEGQCIDSYIVKNGKFSRTKHPYDTIKYIFKRSYIFRKIFLPTIDEHNEEFYENYLLNKLEQLNNFIKDKYNSNLTIIVWPGFPEKYTERFISRLKQLNLDIIFVPKSFLEYDLGYRIENDGHPTAKANKEIAQYLYEYLKGKDNANK